MHDLNWWLMALAFVLGLLLTFAAMIRRVKREVPVTHSFAAGAGVKGGVSAPNVKAPDVKLPDTAKLAGAGAVAAGAAAAGGAAAKLTGGELEEPYGTGSVRLAAGAAAPSGYTIKGNEDSMLYHTTESPSYKQAIAEVWFASEDAAQRAGFLRWDSNRGAGGAAKFVDVPAGPHGKGSAKAGAGGSGPTGWTIKGNEDSMLYHTTDSPSYKQTIAEVWFVDEETAKKAGFDPWDKNFK